MAGMDEAPGLQRFVDAQDAHGNFFDGVPDDATLRLLGRPAAHWPSRRVNSDILLRNGSFSTTMAVIVVGGSRGCT
jgi:hypothetical protein